MRERIAAWFGISGVLLFVLATILGGLQIPGYSHVSQLISESYAIGTPYGIYLRFLGFFPSGIFLAAFAFLSVRSFPERTAIKLGFRGLGIFYGMATCVVSIFPCDSGCNKEFIDPSISQLIHIFTGVVTYITVPLCILMLGIAFRELPNGKFVSTSGIVAGLVCILFVSVLSAELGTEFAGLFQRIIEGSVLAWIVICSLYLRNSNKSVV